MLVRIVGGNGGLAPGFRNTSYLIDGKLLIDAGSVASGLSLEEQLLVENIIISHPHLDHISDLAFLPDNCFGLKGVPFEVYTSKTVRNAIKKHLMNDLIWPDFSKLPSEENPTIRFHDLKPEQMIVLGDYKVFPVRVNHFGDAVGLIIERDDAAILFTQDTGPTERIWEVAKSYKNLKAIFSEVSFPNKMQNVADASLHLTPQSVFKEIAKMPPTIPIFLGHIKPNYKSTIYQEIDELGCERITLFCSDDTHFVF
ncbi:MAG: 3',5'-cyclic-nucleotide phosphodiesterase [Bacteriovoracaceae bacterium]|nr:3',5'-cyclic-nucleotide phosphodiesterase [Candidatus Brocadiales bacterium]MBL6989404.1 3',5'-cyclic-nucleotide phosphodiesterase [Bacteriovoracaceae bacterium]